MIKLLFFGRLSDFAEDVPKQIEAINISEIIEKLESSHPILVQELGSPQVFVAVNKRRSDWQAILQSGDEVAFLPPVTGG